MFLPDPEAKKRYVQGLAEEIFTKDICAWVKIRDRRLFDTITSFITKNFGRACSIKSLADYLRKQGISVKRRTVGRYIRILVDAKSDRFDMKSKRALAGEKKYYLSDLGFSFMRNTDNKRGYGPVLENIVYLYARGPGYAVSVGRTGKLECDFIMRDIDRHYAYVQVADTHTEDCEYRPLEAIRDNYRRQTSCFRTAAAFCMSIRSISCERGSVFKLSSKSSQRSQVQVLGRLFLIG